MILHTEFRRPTDLGCIRFKAVLTRNEANGTAVALTSTVADQVKRPGIVFAKTTGMSPVSNDVLSPHFEQVMRSTRKWTQSLSCYMADIPIERGVPVWHTD